jgi:hypothetical protein
MNDQRLQQKKVNMTKYFLHLSLLTVLIAPHMLRTATCDDCLDFSYDSIASCYLEDDDFDKFSYNDLVRMIQKNYINRLKFMGQSTTIDSNDNNFQFDSADFETLDNNEDVNLSSLTPDQISHLSKLNDKYGLKIDDCFNMRYISQYDPPIKHLCDPATLPITIPTNLQKKLAWGLLKLDEQVVKEALDAGANPNENLNHFIIDSYTGWISAYTLTEKSFYLYGDSQVELNDLNFAITLQYCQKIISLWEILITHNASLDLEISKNHSAKNFRKFIKDNLTPPNENATPFEKKIMNLLLPDFMRLQELIDIYQPEKTKPRVH